MKTNCYCIISPNNKLLAISAPYGIITDVELDAWCTFFRHYVYGLPLEDAIKAYKAIGYRACQFVLTQTKPTSIQSVGPDALNDYELEKIDDKKYKSFIYWYRDISPEGEGIGFGIRQDDTVDFYILGHCSCYGPLDSEFTTITKHQALDLIVRDFNGVERKANDYDAAMWADIKQPLTVTLLSERINNE